MLPLAVLESECRAEAQRRMKCNGLTDKGLEEDVFRVLLLKAMQRQVVLLKEQE